VSNTGAATRENKFTYLIAHKLSIEAVNQKKNSQKTAYHLWPKRYEIEIVRLLLLLLLYHSLITCEGGIDV